MKLINVDAVQAQSLETSIDRFAKVRWSCIVGPLIRAGTVPSSLGSNYQAGRVRKQCLSNQFLAYVWTVGIRSIDEIDIELRPLGEELLALLFDPLAVPKCLHR